MTAILGISAFYHDSAAAAHGLFPLNPIAAEFGANYNVLVTISARDAAPRC